ncbi:MAG TPA: caspase family protein [Steroidobacteraceae bacterium]|nr:caspase family protein [Steroidobacteraceae bacterium]
MSTNESGSRAVALIGAICLVCGCESTSSAPKKDTATEGMVTRQDLEIVECLLPGQVRQLGSTTYITQRRPTRTTTADCRIRGGEYIAYDRADYKSALRVWMTTAEAGDAEAQNNVGEIYERGLGGEPNYEAAIIWYQKAADQGYARAQFNLGTLYEQGLGVEKDRLKALNLYRRAWGLPEDNVMFASAAQHQQDELRAQLQKVIAEKDQQMELLQKQLNQAESDAKKHATTGAASEDSSKEIQALRAWITKLETERRESSGQLANLPAQTREPVARTPTAALDPQAQARLVKGMDFGRYYALIIGNQDYQILEHLQTPRNDAERAGQILKEKYGFTVRIIEDANDVAMLQALNDLLTVLKPNDNLLIYYAGHGTRLKTANVDAGYWLPVNAQRPPVDTFWVANEQITAHLARLPARRILVVADSCYAGLLSPDPEVTMFGTETEFSLGYVKYKLPRRTRLLLASGGDQPVLDTGGQGDSVFARAFIDVLDANSGILTTASLFAQVQAKVKEGAARNHFNQVPEFKAIKSAGHELGDFFFIPRGLGS